MHRSLKQKRGNTIEINMITWINCNAIEQSSLILLWRLKLQRNLLPRLLQLI